MASAYAKVATKLSMTLAMTPENLPWTERMRTTKKDATWDERCNLVRFEGSWADENEKEEIRVNLFSALLHKSSSFQQLTRKHTTTHGYTQLPSQLGTTTIIDDGDWSVVGKKQLPTKKHTVSPVKCISPDNLVCPSCGRGKNAFFPLCRLCTNDGRICPKCCGSKSPRTNICNKCK